MISKHFYVNSCLKGPQITVRIRRVIRSIQSHVNSCLQGPQITWGKPKITYLI